MVRLSCSWTEVNTMDTYRMTYRLETGHAAIKILFDIAIALLFLIAIAEITRAGDIRGFGLVNATDLNSSREMAAVNITITENLTLTRFVNCNLETTTGGKLICGSDDVGSDAGVTANVTMLMHNVTQLNQTVELFRLNISNLNARIIALNGTYDANVSNFNARIIALNGTYDANVTNFNARIIAINTTADASIKNNSDAVLNTLNVSKLLNVTVAIATANLTVTQNLTLNQYQSCNLETASNGNIICGTDDTGSDAGITANVSMLMHNVTQLNQTVEGLKINDTNFNLRIIALNTSIDTNNSNFNARIIALNSSAMLKAVQNDTDVMFVNGSFSMNLSVSNDLHVGGGYGSTGVSFYGNGNISTNGHIKVDGDILGSGADIAERFDTQDDLEPGDVVSIDPSNDEHIVKTTERMDKTVIGVVSTDPSYILNMRSDGKEIGMSGRVPVKVTDEGGIIARGDVLVSSSTPGKAMRCVDLEECSGALIGKALEPMTDSEGVITMVIMLG
ncbi:hypothetical protein J4464_00715 [Candidatus Woesearchaeota archaeon]|nr:hypothetical protein [Candidatus Woesearchaeota archaeon]